MLTRNHCNHVSGFRYACRSICMCVCLCVRVIVQRICSPSTPTHPYVDLFFQSKPFILSLSDALQTNDNDNKIEFSHMINSQQISDAHVCNVSMKRISHRYSSLLHLRNANTNTRKPPSENDSCRQPVT